MMGEKQLFSIDIEEYRAIVIMHCCKLGYVFEIADECVKVDDLKEYFEEGCDPYTAALEGYCQE